MANAAAVDPATSLPGFPALILKVLQEYFNIFRKSQTCHQSLTSFTT
jgi:hypothetical protein